MNEQLVKQSQEQIVKAEPTEALSVYLRKPEVIEKFALVLGNDEEALRYVQSVILLVETSEPGEYSLRNCTKNSILRCALKAAVQKVTVNSEDRQAFMIPNKNKRGEIEARFQFHYQEIYNRAMRTGRYTIINVSPVPEGVEVLEDYVTGMIYLQHTNGLTEDPRPQTSLRLRPYSDRSKPRQGWLGYYRTRFGAEKMIYLSMDEIMRRAHFNKAHAYSFGWKDHREAMEMKTVLLALLRLTDAKADDMREVREALETIDKAENPDTEADVTGENETITEGEVQDIPAEKPEMTPEELAYIAAGEIKTKKGTALKDCDDEMLAYIVANSKDAELTGYARTRLEWHNTHPNPVKPEKQLMTELGY
jgi:phage RecT family recombinase